MIHWRPTASFGPQAHREYDKAWSKSHSLPEGATRVCYDDERRVLMFELDNEHHERHVLTPPPWIGKIGKELFTRE